MFICDEATKDKELTVSQLTRPSHSPSATRKKLSTSDEFGGFPRVARLAHAPSAISRNGSGSELILVTNWLAKLFSGTNESPRSKTSRLRADMLRGWTLIRKRGGPQFAAGAVPPDSRPKRNRGSLGLISSAASMI